MVTRIVSQHLSPNIYSPTSQTTPVGTAAGSPGGSSRKRRFAINLSAAAGANKEARMDNEDSGDDKEDEIKEDDTDVVAQVHSEDDDMDSEGKSTDDEDIKAALRELVPRWCKLGDKIEKWRKMGDKIMKLVEKL